MFDFSFGEMLVVGIVGLLVLGPKELPVVIRYLRTIIRSMKETSNTIRAQIEEVLDADEIRAAQNLIQGNDGTLYKTFSLDEFAKTHSSKLTPEPIMEASPKGLTENSLQDRMSREHTTP